MGLFGDFFDFNKDGKMDSFEKTAEFLAFMQLTESLEEEDSEEIEFKENQGD